MTYYLRDERGVAKAKLSNLAANEILYGTRGFFREATYANGVKKTIYEITEDCKLSLYGGGLEFLFWKGDTLIPEDTK